MFDTDILESSSPLAEGTIVLHSIATGDYVVLNDLIKVSIPNNTPVFYFYDRGAPGAAEYKSYQDEDGVNRIFENTGGLDKFIGELLP